MLLAWVGVGHWLLYALGVTTSYSCVLHGLVQTESFLVAFALGFLYTALPRRTATAFPSAIEMTVAAVALVATTVAAVCERPAFAQMGYVAAFASMLGFAVPRLHGTAAARRPPAAFVLIPIAALHGLTGAALIAASVHPDAPVWTLGLGKLCVEQGVFLCLVIGVGALILPLVSGGLPPPDFAPTARGRAQLAGYALAGLAVFASLVLEQAGCARLGPLARALVVGLALAGVARPPLRKPGAHRQLVRLAVWLTPLGLFLSGVWPDYRVPALHVTFIGGFSLLAFGVATHVVLGHLGLTALAEGRPPAVIVLGITFLVAMLARAAADMSHTYFDHLGWAAGLWLLGSAVWLGSFGPRLLARSRTTPG